MTITTPDHFRASLDAAEQRIAGLLDEARELATRGEDLTGADAERFDALEAEIGEARQRRDFLARLDTEQRSGRLSTEPGHDSAPNRPEDGPWHSPDLFDHRGRVADPDVRSRALTAIERLEHCPDEVRSAGTEAVETGDELVAAWAITASDPAYRSAFWKLAADPTRGHLEFSAAEQAAYAASRAMQRAMSLTDAAGGYMIPFTLDPSIILTDNGELDGILSLPRAVTIATDTWNGVSSTGTDFSWDGEATEVSDDSLTLAQPSIPVHKLQGFIPVSIEAFEDIANLEAEVRRVANDEFNQKLAVALTTGTGSDQPTGIITALDGTGSEVAPATAETYAIDDVYALIEALPARYRMAAQWLAGLPTINSTRQFGTADAHTFLSHLDADTPTRLLGKPLNESSAMRDTGDIDAAATADNHILLVGDWSRFVRVNRTGASVEFIPHLFGGNNRPTGQRGFYMYGRWGADSVDDNGFRVLNVATTA